MNLIKGCKNIGRLRFSDNINFQMQVPLLSGYSVSETNTSESGDSKIVQTTYMDTTEPTGPPTVVEPPDPPDASLQCRGESTSTFTMSNDFVIKENGKNVRVGEENYFVRC